jgi:solute carrier family 25 phosphate transporter 23/24/25/41
MVFSKKQDKKLKKIFETIDSDKNGFLSLEEVSYAIHKFDSEVNEDTIDHLFLKMDTKHDGKISYQEFLTFYYLIPGESLRRKFDSFVKGSFDIGDNIVVPEDRPKGTNPLVTLLAGGIAGAISRTATAPLDRLKTIMQV